VNHSERGEVMASVLIATMLKGDWHKSLQSILSQRGISFEVLLVIDRTPASVPELDLLAQTNSNLVVLQNDDNVGLTLSLIRAASLARGEYLIRHDDDDISHPGRLEKLVSFMGTRGCDVAASFAMARNEGDDDQWLMKSPVSHGEIAAALEKSNCLNHSTIAIRREAYVGAGGYNPVFRYAQDYELYLRLLRRGAKFACLADCLVTRTFGPNSITIQKRKTQMLYSLAAQLLHKAESGALRDILPLLARFLAKYLLPKWARQLRRGVLAKTRRQTHR
jgi:hypothetical protein